MIWDTRFIWSQIPFSFYAVFWDRSENSGGCSEVSLSSGREAGSIHDGIASVMGTQRGLYLDYLKQDESKSKIWVWEQFCVRRMLGWTKCDIQCPISWTVPCKNRSGSQLCGCSIHSLLCPCPVLMHDNLVPAGGGVGRVPDNGGADRLRPLRWEAKLVKEWEIAIGLGNLGDLEKSCCGGAVEAKK